MKLINNALARWEGLDEGLLGPTSLAIRPMFIHEVDLVDCQEFILDGIGVPITRWLD